MKEYILKIFFFGLIKYYPRGTETRGFPEPQDGSLPGVKVLLVAVICRVLPASCLGTILGTLTKNCSDVILVLEQILAMLQLFCRTPLTTA